MADAACQIKDEEEVRWVFACLDALQVFDREDTQLRLEPLLRQCMALDVSRRTGYGAQRARPVPCPPLPPRGGAADRPVTGP